MDQRRHTILIVDDEVDVLESLRHLFHRQYRVLTATGAVEALGLLDRNEVHLILSDQRMPGMTGDAFLGEARRRYPEAIRMLFTGYADIQAIIEAVNQGNVFRYVSKPWDPDQLVATLKEAGEVYDQLSEREALLADLKSHEERCVAFDDQVRRGQAGDVDPAVAAKLENLFSDGRKLLSRLGHALAKPVSTPTH